MAIGKEIRTQIGSIKNTQKITSAMELVAASKMRKAQERMKAGKPYVEELWNVMGHVAQANSEYPHSWFIERPVKNLATVVVSTDRGLCGGLNINLFKRVLEAMQPWQEQKAGISVSTYGSKALTFFSRLWKVKSQKTKLSDAPHLDDLLTTIRVQIEAYNNGEIDRLYLAYNEFVNSIVQNPKVIQLLPLMAADQQKLERSHQWDYLYEPNATQLLDELLERYIEVQVYQAVVENIACEQAARMVAMKSATDNAGDIVNELQLRYNKARQAAITQEISEIVAGAAAT